MWLFKLKLIQIKKKISIPQSREAYFKCDMPTSRWQLLSLGQHHHPRKFSRTQLIRGNAFQAEGRGPGKDTPHGATGGCNTH